MYMEGHGRKRKLGETAFTSSQKKVKQSLRSNSLASRRVKKLRKEPSLDSVTADELLWKVVPTHGDVGGFGDLGGILGLEEVEGVEVVYRDGEGGRVVGFRVSDLLQ
jgi:ATP-dependent RNA helicase DDX24/MAK5